MPIWREGGGGVTTGDGTAKEQKCRQFSLNTTRHFMKYCLSLSLITRFQALYSAATKCATVILLEHSLIKAEIFPALTCSVGHPKKKRQTKKIAYVCIILDWVMFKYHLPASDRLKLPLPLHPGRPPVVRGNLALRCEENHFPCLHEYRRPAPHKTLWYWFPRLYTLPKSFIHYWQQS